MGPRLRPFVADFGLAKHTITGSRYTRSGEALGTPAYMSPEQARGEASALTPASDVWALGCVLYECLAGRPPFDGESAAEVVAGVLTREPRRLRDVAPSVPAGVATVVHTCVSKPPEVRYPSAGALRDDLDRVGAGARPHRRPRRRMAAWLGIAGLGAATVLGALAWPAARPAPAPSADDGDRWAALASRGWTLRASDPAEAVRCLAAALEARPDRHDWRVDLGLLRWSAGDPDGALAEWARVPTEASEADRVAWWRGLLRFAEAVAASRTADLGPARAAWAAGPGRDPTTRPLVEAALALGAGRADEARRRLGDAATWDAALLRGFVESSARVRGQAFDGPAGIRAFDRALAAGIPLAWAFASRGTLHAAGGDAARADADYEAALRLDPRNTVAWNGRALLRLDAGDATAAIEALDAALRVTPDDPALLANRSDARRRARDYAGALQDAEAAVARDPTLVAARMNRGLAVLDFHRYADAIVEFTAVLAARPDDADAYRHRGVARQLSGDRDGALDDFTAALARVPDDAIARWHRGGLRLERGDRFGARDDLRVARQATPDDPQVAWLTAWALYQCGDWAEAIAEARRTLAMGAAAAHAERMRYVIEQCEARLAAATPR